MQKFSKFSPTEYLNQGIPKLYDDIATVLSNSSGSAFPTENLQEGMTCYRTDLKQTYRLTKLEGNKPTWTLESDANFQPGKAEYDTNGHEIEKYYLTVHGGSVDKPLKYTGSDFTDQTMLTTKNYVDKRVDASATDLRSAMEKNNTGLDNSLKDMRKNGVDKLTTARKINSHPFDGTQDVTITPSDIDNGESEGSKVKSISAGLSVTAKAIPRGSNKQVSSVTPESITFTQQEVKTVPAFSKTEGMTLAEVIGILIQNCHTHTSEQKSSTAEVNCWGNCNCNCDCDCNCGDDAGSS